MVKKELFIDAHSRDVIKILAQVKASLEDREIILYGYDLRLLTLPPESLGAKMTDLATISEEELRKIEEAC
ncbi:MAG: hypothetical protein LBM97_01590 [Candidatus Nomurabacteria bacterium]|nr:hypothetical protein [Candidatus Nomurabacteria bacterium]